MYRIELNGVVVSVDSLDELRELVGPLPGGNGDSPGDIEVKTVALHSVPTLSDREDGGEIIAMRPQYIETMEVLLAFDKEGITSRGVAEFLGLNHATASSRLARLQDRGLAIRKGWTWRASDRALNASRFLSA